jgi:transposase
VFGRGPATRIYLVAGVTDMRKGFEGLYGLVLDRLSCEALRAPVLVLHRPAQSVEGQRL